MKKIISIFLVIVFVFLLSGLPQMFEMTENEVKFSVAPFMESLENYITGIPGGDSFHYQVKHRTHHLFDEVGFFFITSLYYLLLAGIVGITLGGLVGVWLAAVRKEWIKDIIGFLGMIPDFILILLLQFLVIAVYQSTGYKFAMVASTMQEQALLLPLITLTLIPAIYLANNISIRTYQILTEDYILTAKAKGMNKLYIYIRHIFRNALPFLKADLHKIAGIMLGNLFITEYLYNITGITRLMFGYGTQFNLVVNTMFAVIFLYLVFLWGMKAFVVGLERIFAND